MQVRVVRIAVICISVIFTGLIFTGQSIAAIDRNTVTGLWLFDDGSGSVASDSSGNGLDATLIDGPAWVAGRFGGALEFDGVAAYVEVPAHSNPTEAITISLWVKSPTDTWSQNGFLVSKRNAYIIHPNSGTTDVAFPLCNGGCWNLPGAWSDGATGPEDITQWHMYTGTFDSSTGEWKLYVDAEVVSTLDLDQTPVDEDTDVLWIGRDQCCDPRYGSATIDEVAIFNVALSEADIQDLMNNGLSVSVLAAVEPADKLTTTWANVKTQY